MFWLIQGRVQFFLYCFINFQNNNNNNNNDNNNNNNNVNIQNSNNNQNNQNMLVVGRRKKIVDDTSDNSNNLLKIFKSYTAKFFPGFESRKRRSANVRTQPMCQAGKAGADMVQQAVHAARTILGLDMNIWSSY